jgi:hypothetical protein
MKLKIYGETTYALGNDALVVTTSQIVLNKGH